MKKVLVLGAGGMLGHKLCQCLEGHEIIGTVRKDADFYRRFPEVFDNVKLIGNLDALDFHRLDKTIQEVRPDFIVNCIGIVKQLGAAKDAYLSVAINSYLPHRLARFSEQIGARLILMSTDCVFDGTRGAYCESSFSDARDLYGKSKFLGETTPEESSAVTLRTSFIGRELTNPTHGLVEWFLSHKGKTVKGFAKAIYSGFTTIEMARIIAMIIEGHTDLCGVYHLASEPIDKYNLLCMIKDVFGLDTNIEKDEDFVCKRDLLMERFSEVTGYVAPSWETMIRQMYEDPTDYVSMREFS
jgi:dTDP-4-dehydrorhamnose reductase